MCFFASVVWLVLSCLLLVRLACANRLVLFSDPLACSLAWLFFPIALCFALFEDLLCVPAKPPVLSSCLVPFLSFLPLFGFFLVLFSCPRCFLNFFLPLVLCYFSLLSFCALSFVSLPFSNLSCV